MLGQVPRHLPDHPITSDVTEEVLLLDTNAKTARLQSATVSVVGRYILRKLPDPEYDLQEMR